MKRILTIIMLCTVSLLASAQIKPISGTFVNFFWQDERNNYTNQRNVDQSDPALWECKVNELHEMGINCIIIVTVANEGKAMYPSSFMPHAYTNPDKSPVDAIMETADKLGMQVILGTGWAKNQLDDLSDPYIIETHRKIMEELAALYTSHPSFYAWYIPVEGCFIPYLSDHAVKGVNEITARVRTLTPGVKVLISPYGLFAADFDNPKFEQSIMDLDVDIIAFQDEIGCVRETFPMQNMKRNFARVGEIQKKTGIEFWANVETFTWDRNPNNWYSTLIPASFGRILSQMAGVSQAGATKIISFIVCGMFDKPGTPYPVGQRVYAGELYNNYMAWMNGDPRWKLLEDILTGKEFGTYTVAKGPQAVSDGKFGWEDPSDTAWQAFEGGSMECIIDLGSRKEINTVGAHFCDYYGGDIFIPQCLTISVSNDGKHWKDSKTVTYESWPNKFLDCWTDVIMADGLNAKGRYVKVTALTDRGTILCSEIIVK